MPTVHRFCVEEPLEGGAGAITALPSHVARQMDVVLRLRPGDQVALFDGRGGEWAAEVLSLRRCLANNPASSAGKKATTRCPYAPAWRSREIGWVGAEARERMKPARHKS